MRIVQISDTHLCHDGGVTRSNVEAVVDYVNGTLRPDLIVHTGDAVLLWPDEGDDRAAAREALDAFDAPLVVLPGNHDVGEPGPKPWAGVGVTSERVELHRDVFGEDRFVETFDDWAVVGLNSELLGSGLDEEDDQWEWLELAAADLPDRVVLFLHKPLWTPGDKVVEHTLAIEPEARERLLGCFRAGALQAVGSGHLHTHHEGRRDGLLEVWAPSTAFVVTLPELARSPVGVIEWRLGDGGVETTLHTPPGIEAREATAVPELVESMERVAPDQLKVLAGEA